MLNSHIIVIAIVLLRIKGLFVGKNTAQKRSKEMLRRLNKETPPEIAHTTPITFEVIRTIVALVEICVFSSIIVAVV